MGRIPQDFIDGLLARCDIVEVIESRVQLKKAGREYKACCPFHDENTPSFTVSPSKQFYHCFGCGAHGNVVGFLMEYDGLGFIDAVEELAERVGLEVPREAGARPEGHDLLYPVLTDAARWYRQRLKESDEAIAYLKRRGVSGSAAARFGLGFAPDEWQGLIEALGSSRDLRKALAEVGLTSKSERGREYDKFRHRLMFPIHDSRGRVVAFGGRDLGEDGPKYLNSPETPLFHKGRMVYGLHLAKSSGAKTSGSKSSGAKQALGRLDRLVVVEGYMDVIALADHGIEDAVATLGTAVTSDQAELLFRSAPTLVFCFDGDRAGRQAAWRALEAVLPRMREGRQARFLFLPEGEDPDSLVRGEGAERFKQRLAEATGIAEYFFQRMTSDVEMTTLDGRARFVEQARPYLEQIPEGAFRDLMFAQLKELGGTIGSQERSNRSRGDGRQGDRRPGDSARSTSAVAADARRTPVRTAISLLLQDPARVRQLQHLDEFIGLDVPGLPLLMELVELLTLHPELTTGGILEHFRDHRAEPHLAKLAALEHPGEDEELAQVLAGAFNQLRAQAREARIRHLQGQAEAPGECLSEEEKQELRDLLRRHKGLQDPGQESS